MRKMLDILLARLGAFIGDADAAINALERDHFAHCIHEFDADRGRLTECMVCDRIEAYRASRADLNEPLRKAS